MPELPEVESVIRGLKDGLVGSQLIGLECFWEKTIAGLAVSEFRGSIRGNVVKRLSRRGKYIIIHTDHSTIVIHLRMTGRLYLCQEEDQFDADQWLRITFLLKNGKQLRFSDLRKFGRITLVDDLPAFFSHLGPEPLSSAFTFAAFQSACASRRKSVKTLLLDQGIIAGVGNIYADESCFLAGVHPARISNTLTSSEMFRLYRSIREVLHYAIKFEGSSFQWYRKPDGSSGKLQDHFYVFNRECEPCRSCTQPIVKMRHRGRGTHFCPFCQPIT